MHHNPTTPVADHKNKWENVGHMDAYYVVGVTSIPYPGFEAIINIFSKEVITYRVTIGDF